MCGILGWVSREPVPLGFEGALETLAHRGPDGRGTWRSPDGRALFGHSRLAILDPTPRGAQPSIASGGRSVFIHNGQIYNFRELRGRLESKGERFASETDTEVAHRWLEGLGPEGLEGLEGMFALALWSQRERRLLLARDRLGVKPLYYARLPRGLAFASQPRALLALPPISARLDPEALSDFLAYGYVPFDRCLFAGIHKLPPSHFLLYEPDGGRLEIRQYWRLERRDIRDDPDDLRELLGQAVSSHLVSDVPVGAFLSGGLDSTTVVALASREIEAIPTFALGYDDGDLSDVAHARIASDAFGTRHREEFPGMEGVGPALARCAEAYDEPFYDPRSVPMLDLARAARRLVKVVLSGDGGDEVFGGYGWHETVMRYESRRTDSRRLQGLFALLWRGIVKPLADHPRASRLAGSARFLSPDFTERYFAVRGFFPGSEQRRVLGRTPEDAARLFRQFDRPDLPIVHRLLWLDLHTYLPDNGLALVDRSTMSVGLEVRVPLLDRKLVEYAFSLPPRRLLRPGATKVAFREAVDPWLPEAIRTRPKSGFSPPFKRWLGGTAREAALRILEQGMLARDGVLDASGVRALVEGGTQRRYNKLWLLLTLEAWYSRWIVSATRSVSPPSDTVGRSDRAGEKEVEAAAPA
jgi:asparagine synthase (glutamine-hydrolysing)